MNIDHLPASNDEDACTLNPQAQAWSAHALASFEQFISNTPGFRARQGQHAMAQRIAATLSQADLGEHPEPTRAIALIQAGTGVGKSAAYLSTTIALALERKVRVLISTATVALQEQLVHKDLPTLARGMERPFTYALAKGRGRYVCTVKLEHMLQNSGNAEDALFADEALPATTADRLADGSSTAPIQELRVTWYHTLYSALSQGHWDGDHDNLEQVPDMQDWSRIAAERHTCTARYCPHFRNCSYYLARAKLAQATVIVANHDLVLASLNMKTLPELEDCLVVFDEGHHLPAVALRQFACAMDVSHVRWIEKLPRMLQEIAHQTQVTLAPDVDVLCNRLIVQLQELARLTLGMVHAKSDEPAMTLRLAQGVLPHELHKPMQGVHAHATSLFNTLHTLGQSIKDSAKDDPNRAHVCAREYARLGSVAPRVASLLDTSALLLEHGSQSLAKWLAVQQENGYLHIRMHACPIVPGDLLRQFLWNKVRAAVVTSATLSTCGNFDYFLREAGLAELSHVNTLEVISPFDYARQGRLTVVHTRSDPKQAHAYTAEMVRELCGDLANIEKGALVLFTSRAQMRAAVDALPPALQGIVLVQDQHARTQLLEQHAHRIKNRQPSIIFGLQSFGEGLDLPGALCETLCIAKLPFASPSDPIDEARAEWLRSLGRDPFMELVVPATGMKLLQWSGRALRSEDDHAHIICYDKRLQLQGYGRKMLASLPPYSVQRREGR